MPYPATAYLKGYLETLGHEVFQKDMSLDVTLKMFSREKLKHVFDIAAAAVPRAKGALREKLEYFTDARSNYENTIDDVIRFLQGGDDSLALRIAARQWLPEGPRFLTLFDHPELLEKFGELGVRDRAKYLASLYLDDLVDLIREAVDPQFNLSRYGEELAASQNSFSPLYERLVDPAVTLMDRWIEEQVVEYQAAHAPEVVGLSCPFPGNVYAGLKAARVFKSLNANVKVVMGGGFVNTELRDLSDTRMFEFIDALVFDDGERPFELLLRKFAGEENVELLRTMTAENGRVIFHNGPAQDVSFKTLPGPDYEGLDLRRYISMMEMPNPMHRMWSDFKWNKLMLAHGCYWKKCTFCDVNLDYIGRYEPARVENLIAQMKKVSSRTGFSGFHFVDEAAPPAILKALSEKIMQEKLNFTWWGNIRFDKQFTPEVTRLMAEAGCVAVTGGLEVASPRLLELVKKGVSIEQVARVTKAFVDAGIFVHAYLIYGFPSQTVQETVDSLEVVRQLFVNGCLHSAHWHRFVATIHSPIGRHPGEFGVRLEIPELPGTGRFALNVVPFVDTADAADTDHGALGVGLSKALYNYMHGMGLDEDVRNWFKAGVPKTKVPRRYIENALNGASEPLDADLKRRVSRK
jgi:hypothetical protein